MIVGKTITSISIPELFEKYPETSILKAVFPEITSIPCKIKSPFRTDMNPSFSIYLDNNHHVRFKDFGDPDCRGGLLDLLCRKWKCTFNQVFDRILDVMQQQECAEGFQPSVKMKPIRTLTRRESAEQTKLQVKVRPWKDYDYEYWASYGVEKQWLKYAGIHPISHKIVTKKDSNGKPKTYIFPADKLAYVFCEYKETKLSMKIYMPYNKKGYKWCSSMDASVISLWTKVPEYGDRIVICSSLKDSLCISCKLHIPAIAPQGEGYNLSATAVKELKRRYKKVFICFDTDKPGLRNSKKLSEQTGFIRVVPDFKGEKDFSDYYKSLENKSDFKQLETLFH